MRIAPVAAIAVLVVSLSPLVARAQFQQPTQEELQMTSDPLAPGAAAVYLNIEEKADDNLSYKTFYARIKVLTEKGKELATVSVPYIAGSESAGGAKVTDIKARTIHPDGTVIPLVGKPEDLLTAKSGDLALSRKVFTLPSVEVGSILEYRYEIHLPDGYVSSPEWEIQRPYFVHKAHYSFIPFKAFLSGSENVTSREIQDANGHVLDNLIWWTHLPPGTPPLTHDAMGRFSLDVSNVPAAPDEEWMPPIDSILYKVVFYYKGSYTADQFWADVAKRWSKDVDHFADPSRAIHAAVDGIVSPSDSELDKARKLYAAVQALDNTDYSRQKSASEMKQLKIKAAKRAEDTWSQKSGNSEEIALLYLAMLRAAGLKAWALKVRNRDNGPFDQTYMYADQFDDTLVILETADGKAMALDPGEKMCPFQSLSWRHSSVGGMRQSAQGPGFTITPEQKYVDNTTTREGDIFIDAHGHATGHFTIIMTGQEALHWRQAALRNDDAELKKQFDRQLAEIVPAGIEAHVDHFLAIDQPDSNLMAIVNVVGGMGAATAHRIMLPGFFFEGRDNLPFVKEEKRLEPVDMHYGERVTDQVTYHLPEGMSVEGAPQDDKIAWTGHAIFLTKTKSDPGQFIVACSLARAFTQAKPDEYQDLRGFYQKVAAAGQQELVLHAAPAEKGN